MGTVDVIVDRGVIDSTWALDVVVGTVVIVTGLGIGIVEYIRRKRNKGNDQAL